MVSNAGSSTGRTTASMLSGIHCETANELVMAVRYSTNPPGPTYIPTLDEILGVARPHPGGSRLQRGDLIEVIGSSGSGKTTVLNFFLLTTILPSSFTIPLPPPGSHDVEVVLGGKGRHAALLYPLTHRSSVLPLADALRAHIVAQVLDALSTHLRPRVVTPALEVAITNCVRGCLTRITVVRFKPRYKHLYLALRSILAPSSVRQLGTFDRPDTATGLDLVVVDGLGDGFWPERFASEEKHSTTYTARYTSAAVRSSEDIGMRDVVHALDAVRKELGSVVVLSVQGLWPQENKPNKGKEVDQQREAIMAREGKPKIENGEGEDDVAGTGPGQTRHTQRRKLKVYNNFFQTHLPHMPTLPGISPDENRSWPLNIQLTLRGRSRGLQLPADMTLVDALRGLELDGGDNTKQKFEGFARVGDGRGPAGTVNGERFTWGIGEHGLEVGEESAS